MTYTLTLEIKGVSKSSAPFATNVIFEKRVWTDGEIVCVEDHAQPLIADPADKNALTQARAILEAIGDDAQGVAALTSSQVDGLMAQHLDLWSGGSSDSAPHSFADFVTKALEQPEFAAAKERAQASLASLVEINALRRPS